MRNFKWSPWEAAQSWFAEERVSIKAYLFIMWTATWLASDEILQPIAIPSLQRIGVNSILQDDNTRPHCQAVKRLPWNANSPDLNPIEHLWDELGRRIRQNQPPPKTLAEQLQNLPQEWNSIPQSVRLNLVQSMRGCCRGYLVDTPVRTVQTFLDIPSWWMGLSGVSTLNLVSFLVRSNVNVPTVIFSFGGCPVLSPLCLFAFFELHMDLSGSIK